MLLDVCILVNIIEGGSVQHIGSANYSTNGSFGLGLNSKATRAAMKVMRIFKLLRLLRIVKLYRSAVKAKKELKAHSNRMRTKFQKSATPSINSVQPIVLEESTLQTPNNNGNKQ